MSQDKQVKLARYDDRVEIVNPGSFPSNVTMKELRAGNKSEPRNPSIARVMYLRKAVESWGRGIKLMIDECVKAGLPEPKIIVEGGYTKTVFSRSLRTYKGGMKTAESIVLLVKDKPQISIDDIASRLEKARSTIIKQIDRLKAAGILRRVGPDRGGHWEIVEE